MNDDTIQLDGAGIEVNDTSFSDVEESNIDIYSEGMSESLDIDKKFKEIQEQMENELNQNIDNNRVNEDEDAKMAQIQIMQASKIDPSSKEQAPLLYFKIKYPVVIISLIPLLVLGVIPWSENIAPQMRCLGLLIYACILWAFEGIPAHVTALSIPMFASLLKIVGTSFADGAQQLIQSTASNTPFVAIGGFAIALGMKYTGLDTKIISAMLQFKITRKPAVFLLLIITLEYLLTIAISNVSSLFYLTMAKQPRLEDKSNSEEDESKSEEDGKIMEICNDYYNIFEKYGNNYVVCDEIPFDATSEELNRFFDQIDTIQDGVIYLLNQNCLLHGESENMRQNAAVVLANISGIISDNFIETIVKLAESEDNIIKSYALELLLNIAQNGGNEIENEVKSTIGNLKFLELIGDSDFALNEQILQVVMKWTSNATKFTKNCFKLAS
ncbi:MAG: hypothetical protein EZS28_005877 [Streblomastix strix]|uniref:Uncharacterized protein n=1 Tax=Streblomastix strix TaxID=222440 RepID=A0A5J4WVI5_9EUKA|nr:MAG: hypothetical protein EZS28_005877 [Streblomastix strix]